MAQAGSLDAARRAMYQSAEAETALEWSRGATAMPGAPQVGPSVLLASLSINLLSLALPVVILQVYDRILPNSATETLLFLMVGLVVVLMLDGILRVVRSHITGWTAARFEHLAGCAAVDRLLSTDITAFERDAPGIHLDRISAIDALRDFHAGQAKLLIVDLPFVLLFLGLIWIIAGPLVLVPVVLLAVLAVTAILVGLALKQSLHERADLDDRRYNFIIEALSGIHTVKVMAMEALLQRRYERLQESGAATTYRSTFLSNVATAIGSLFSNLTMVSVAAVGATYVMATELSIGGLAACTLLAGRAVQPLLRALGLWTQFQNIQVASQRVDTLFSLEPEARAADDNAGKLSGAVELQNVSFAYGADEPTLFDKINLKIKPGEIIGISGGTGSGKTSLLMLMMNALRPTEGRVLFDGIEVSHYKPDTLRRQVAYLAQNAVLFQGTILENITMFRGSEATEAGLAAAQLLGLDKQIHRLPAGFETRVGDGAQDELPTGLKQGIVMARALAGNPCLILFDEANSALDSRSDSVLKGALQSLKGGPSMVLVSHRPSMLKLADRVFEIDNGKLVQRPTDGAQSATAAAAQKGSPPASPATSMSA